MELSKTQKITYIALLIALQIVMGRFVGFKTLTVTINFSFLPLVINAILFGPISAAVSAAIADVFGTLLFSNGMAYFPGFTLSSALTGLVYGLLLYRKPNSILRIAISCLITNIFISLGLGTYWVYMMTGKGFFVLLPSRILQNAVMIPTKFFVIWIFVYRIIPLVWKGVIPEIKSDKKAI